MYRQCGHVKSDRARAFNAISAALSEKLTFRLKLSLRLMIIYRRWKTNTRHDEMKYLLALEVQKSPLLRP